MFAQADMPGAESFLELAVATMLNVAMMLIMIGIVMVTIIRIVRLMLMKVSVLMSLNSYSTDNNDDG